MRADSIVQALAGASAELSDVLAWVRAGRPIVLLDDVKEHEGDVYCAAQVATPEVLQFMVRRASGLLCMSMSRARLEEIGIPRFSELIRDAMRSDDMDHGVKRFWLLDGERRLADTPFHLPVDLKTAHSGVSVAERYAAIQRLLSPDASIADFMTPGHLFTLGAHYQGLRGRQGHTEVSVALAQAAGLAPAGLLCEVVGDDGDMLRGQEMVEYVKANGLEVVAMSYLREALASL